LSKIYLKKKQLHRKIRIVCIQDRIIIEQYLKNNNTD